VYEDINLFKRSLGQTSDVVNKQLLELASSKEDEGYALRPEGTASVVRSYLEHSFDKNETISKFFYIGPMFRGERPQKGRLRQFHQIGVEVISPSETMSHRLDAEVLILCMHLLREFKVKEPKLKINSLGSKEDKERISLWLRGEFAKHKKELCEDCQERFERNVFRVLDCKNEKCRKTVNSIVKDLPLSEKSKEYFNGVQKTLTEAGIDFRIDPHLVRGLDYYTHTVFEITAGGELGSQNAIGAGGNYEQLLHDLGGDLRINYRALGFAIGIERILLASQIEKPMPGIDVFLVTFNCDDTRNEFKLLNFLRQNGINADMNYLLASFKSQMSRANRLNARYVLIIGEDEVKNNTVAVKDMKTGTQEAVEIKNIVSNLKGKLAN
jgi:histidyl-tRNA synthetase